MKLLSRLRLRFSRLPLRIRLSLWYTLSLGVILLLFALFLYVQVRRSLIASVDASLLLAANQALLHLGEREGQLSFQTSSNNAEAGQNLNDDFVIQLLAKDGTVLETLSSDKDIPVFAAEGTGFHTWKAEGDPWRVYRQEVSAGTQQGQLQIGQELEPVTLTLLSLQAQLLLGLPFALFLAGWGGFFLVARALRPIDQITHTAQAISATDLGQRIGYEGAADEVGRLAQTFDSMLNRLQTAFVHERRFTSDAAHELRTPLTALKGRIGVTLNQPRQPEQYTEILQEMEHQVDRLIRLSNDLLFMARLGQRDVHEPNERLELGDFLAAIVDQVRPLAEAKFIQLTEMIPSGVCIEGQMDLLIRLFLNLLDNAVKYTPPNGRVTIQAQEQEPWLQVAIRDSGAGIAREHLPYLFERFYRVEGDRGRYWQDNGQGGAGLGLAIAQEIVSAHGGKLWVESELGQGTAFFVQLPICASENPKGLE